MRSGGGARQAAVFPFPCPARVWAGVSLGASVMFGGAVLWLALRNYRAVCPNCGLGVRWEPWLRSAVLPSGRPWGSFSGGTAGRSARTAVMVPWGGSVGWTRESFILWAGVVACLLAALWGAFHLALLLALLFTW